MSEHTLMRFVSYVYREGVKARTIKSYLATVHHAQILLRPGDPKICDMPQLEYVIRGIKKCTGQLTHTRLPITPGLMRSLRKHWIANNIEWDFVMLWATACMCFFGFMRTGEIVVPSDSGFDHSVHMAFGDVRVDSRLTPIYLVVNLKASKTDPFRQGVQIYLGRTNAKLCPVSAILNCMVKRGAAGGAFFSFGDGKLLTRDRFVKAVRSALEASRINPSNYAGHSFRIGAATTAASCGLQDSLIKTLGQWESATYILYVRTLRETLYAVSRSLSVGH